MQIAPALDWPDCPAVESIPGKRSGAWAFRDTTIWKSVAAVDAATPGSYSEVEVPSQ